MCGCSTNGCTNTENRLGFSLSMKKVFLKTKKENCDRSSLDRVEANKLERANSYLLVLVEKRKFVIDE